MASQALYRRYRPRRFGELKGQEHVVRALRNAVIHHREGQAYLFSGPRGTGKTSSARILAKVLNCEAPVEGEPCCACASCLAVESGTSYDVHELDAASNNGVDAMRDLIEKTMLGTPGRHKVYILDEVHMLSKGAEAALLKTLEEPPPHVVFVLATTDPQKVSETIRSRTQHLQFHLLPMDELEAHVRWVIADAGLEIADEAIESVLRRGGGSARDTLSALELVAASGGMAPEEAPLDEFIESMIESDPGRGLAAVAASIRQGRDSRTLAESLVAHLRDCFLSIMAPELVALPDQRAAQVAELATRLGAPATVRAIEQLGSMLVEMRHAPDPRVLLEVALVKLCSPSVDSSTAALVARIEQLERTVARGGPAPGGGAAPTSSAPAPAPAATAPATSAPASAQRPERADRPAPAAPRPQQDPEPTTRAPQDPSTGRAVLGGRARRAEPESPAAPAPVGSSPAAPAAASTPTPAPAPSTVTRPPAETPRPVDTQAATDTPLATETPPATETLPPVTAAAPGTATAALTVAGVTSVWSSVIDSLKGLAKPMYAAARIQEAADGVVVLALPTEPHRSRCEQFRTEVERLLGERVGAPVRARLVTDEASSPAAGSASSGPPAEDDVDLSELVDAPPEAVANPVDRVAAAFPGAQVIDEDR